MDGVLEVCWEDELKKDPAKPQSLLLQTNDDGGNDCFTASDKIEIQKYYEKLQKLQYDRHRYIAKLFDEKASLENGIQLQLTKLNRCVENIIKTKVKAQFAISSEQLKILICTRDGMQFKIIGEKERKYV